MKTSKQIMYKSEYIASRHIYNWTTVEPVGELQCLSEWFSACHPDNLEW